MLFKDTSRDEVIDRDIDVTVRSAGQYVTIPLCRTFVRDDELWVCVSPPNGKYTAPVPKDAVFTLNESDLAAGRFRLRVTTASRLGQLVVLRSKAARRGARCRLQVSDMHE